MTLRIFRCFSSAALLGPLKFAELETRGENGPTERVELGDIIWSFVDLGSVGQFSRTISVGFSIIFGVCLLSAMRLVGFEAKTVALIEGWCIFVLRLAVLKCSRSTSI